MEVGLTQIPADHETLSMVCHVGILVDLSSMIISLDLRLSPSSVERI